MHKPSWNINSSRVGGGGGGGGGNTPFSPYHPVQQSTPATHHPNEGGGRTEQHTRRGGHTKNC